MRHFEGMVVQNNHSETGTRYFEEIRRTGTNLIFQVGASVHLRTDRSGWPVLTNGKSPVYCDWLECLLSVWFYDMHLIENCYNLTNWLIRKKKCKTHTFLLQ